jgi:hypothetical protein
LAGKGKEIMMVVYEPYVFFILILLLILIIRLCCKKIGQIRGVKEPRRAYHRWPESGTGITAEELKEDPIITLIGPGVFISAIIWKQGSDTGTSEVKIKIDGEREFVRFPFAKGPIIGLNQNNPSGLASFHNSDTKSSTITIGFSTPLIFKDTFELFLDIKEDGIDKILTEVYYGEAKWDPGPGAKPDPDGEI